jgi:hypothetical protein
MFSTDQVEVSRFSTTGRFLFLRLFVCGKAMSNELLKRVREIERHHKDDRDGGYDLISELVRLKEGLDGAQKADLLDVFIDLATELNGRIWGVSLAVIATEQSQELSEKLQEIFAKGPRDPRWRDQVILTLIKVGSPSALPLIVSYIEESMIENRFSAGMLIANLGQLSIEESVRLGALFFSRFMGRSASRVDGFLPAFIRIYANCKEGSLSALVARTSAINPPAGHQLRAKLEQTLGKPWLASEFGLQKIAALQQEVRDSSPG